MALPNKRSVMTLYSDAADIHSHRVRFVLAEKGIMVDILHVSPDNLPEDLIELNPYSSLPTMVDRDLVLYDSRIIMDYLDERFPHPPLLPVYPVARSKSRLMIYRIERDWYTLLEKIDNSTSESEADKARTRLRDSLTALAPVFADSAYFLNEEFTLVDCALAPLLWRLPSAGVELPPKAKAVKEYAARMFKRASFKASLSDEEREMADLQTA
ncbi:MAG: sspA [Gammaproteobacteria bacterium]|jgi:RNA polymerase-associated protein|nr:sspA [Gammaproteobacteria bacterium]